MLRGAEPIRHRRDERAPNAGTLSCSTTAPAVHGNHQSAKGVRCTQAGERGNVKHTTPRSIGLALVPVLALTVGIPLANRVEPRIAGLPFLLAYIVIWILLTPLFLYTVYRLEGRP
jgi:hypothetical protein